MRERERKRERERERERGLTGQDKVDSFLVIPIVVVKETNHFVFSESSMEQFSNTGNLLRHKKV